MKPLVTPDFSPVIKYGGVGACRVRVFLKCEFVSDTVCNLEIYLLKGIVNPLNRMPH
ncbi:MAG: hypothetical protein J0L67_18355 [Cytophagales bacterium]|nr:hypothetical protein [Cytophagales bacterium]